MEANDREHLFEQAMVDYRKGRLRLAEHGLRRLVDKLGSRDPSHLSLYGLVLAHRTRAPQSVRYCEEAVEKNGRRASVLYLHLARALTACGRKRDAVDALNRGLLLHERDRRLRKELQRLVPRRPPSFPSLGRRHPVNKYLGLARTLGGRLWYGLGPSQRDT